MIIISGFNRFNQLNSLQTVLIESIMAYRNSHTLPVHSHFIKKCTPLQSINYINEYFAVDCDRSIKKCQIWFSWSYCLFYERNLFWFCGFFGGKSNYIKTLESPNKYTVLQASCNQKHVVCVLEDGSFWQYNIQNGLWRDLTSVLHTEAHDKGSTRVAITKLCCGVIITAVLTSNGEVFNLPNKLSLPGKNIVDIACGRAHILMLSDKGEVFSVGEGSRGQLGHGELEAEEDPRLVQGLAGLTVVAIACGGWHSCAVTADGDLYTWGWNMCGQLGLGTSSRRVSVQALPVVVDWPEQMDVHVRTVACGARHTVTITDDGSVWGCGWNEYGQLALPGVKNVDQMTKLPVPHSGVQDLLCGPWNTCLIT